MSYDIRSISQMGTSEPFELQVARGQIPGHLFVHRMGRVPQMSNNALLTAAYDIILIKNGGPL